MSQGVTRQCWAGHGASVQRFCARCRAPALAGCGATDSDAISTISADYATAAFTRIDRPEIDPGGAGREFPHHARHRLPPQPLPSIVTLSMSERGAEDKPKRGQWSGTNLQ
jgi:hypothetical protein